MDSSLSRKAQSTDPDIFGLGTSTTRSESGYISSIHAKAPPPRNSVPAAAAASSAISTTKSAPKAAGKQSKPTSAELSRDAMQQQKENTRPASATDPKRPDISVAAVAIKEKEKGNESFKAGDFQDAVVCYTRSLNADSTSVASAIVYANRGLVYHRLKNFEAAEDDCSMAVSRDPSYVKAWSRRAAARFARGKYLHAIEDCVTALKLKPGDVELLKQKVEAEKKLKETEGDNAAALLKAGPPASTTASGTKFRRIAIQEDDDDSEEEEQKSTPPPVKTSASAPATAAAASTAAPTKPTVADVKFHSYTGAPTPASTSVPAVARTSDGKPMKKVVIEEVSSDDEAEASTQSAVKFSAKATATPTPVVAAVAPAPRADPSATQAAPSDDFIAVAQRAYSKGEHESVIRTLTAALPVAAEDTTSEAATVRTAVGYEILASARVQVGLNSASIADCSLGLAALDRWTGAITVNSTEIRGKLLLRRGFAHDASEKFTDALVDLKAATTALSVRLYVCVCVCVCVCLWC
jgi:hypothetical protein